MCPAQISGHAFLSQFLYPSEAVYCVLNWLDHEVTHPPDDGLSYNELSVI